MTMLYGIAIALHVVLAVLGVGLVGAIPLVARLSRRATERRAGGEELLAVLLRATQIAFALMVVTGILLDVSVGGAFHGTTWFRLSILVLVLAGVSHARARASLRAANGNDDRRASALLGVERWGLLLCACIATLTVLMQLKPTP